MPVAPVPFAPWDAVRAASLMANTIGRQTEPSILSRAGSALPSGVVLDDLDNCVLDLSDEQTIDRRDNGMASGHSTTTMMQAPAGDGACPYPHPSALIRSGMGRDGDRCMAERAASRTTVAARTGPASVGIAA